MIHFVPIFPFISMFPSTSWNNVIQENIEKNSIIGMKSVVNWCYCKATLKIFLWLDNILKKGSHHCKVAWNIQTQMFFSGTETWGNRLNPPKIMCGKFPFHIHFWQWFLQSSRVFKLRGALVCIELILEKKA